MCIVYPMDVESPAVFECAQAGCARCVEALLRRHERLVHSILRREQQVMVWPWEPELRLRLERPAEGCWGRSLVIPG